MYVLLVINTQSLKDSFLFWHTYPKSVGDINKCIMNKVAPKYIIPYRQTSSLLYNQHPYMNIQSRLKHKCTHSPSYKHIHTFPRQRTLTSPYAHSSTFTFPSLYTFTRSVVRKAEMFSPKTFSVGNRILYAMRLRKIRFP